MRKRKPTRSIKDRINGVDEILITELEIDHDEELTPNASLEMFPGYDDEWTDSYLVALIEKEFDIEIPDNLTPHFRTVQDVHDFAQSILKG